MASVTVYSSDKVDDLTDVAVISSTISGGHLIHQLKSGGTIDVGAIAGSVGDATDTLKGVVELATDTETITGTDSSRVITPLSLSALTATDTRRGLVELATPAEAAAGSDASRAITSAGLLSIIASASQRGLVLLATSSEALAGTDTAKAITSATLASVVGPINTAVSGKQASNTNLTAISALTPTNDDVLQRKSGVWANRTMAQLATDLQGTGEFPNTMLYSGSAYADADGSNVYIGAVDPGSVPNGSVWLDTSA